jgi:uncharacterized RDD family membrane protein YckC
LNSAAPHYAGFWRRLGAWLLDIVLAWSAFVCVLLVWSGVTGHAEPWDEPATTPVIGATALGVFILGRCLDAWLQGTPGKFLMGCRVIDARSGRNMRCRQSLWRGLAMLLAALPAGLGIFRIGWNLRKQGLHDRLAGSLVILEDEALMSLAELAAAA